MAAEMQGNGTRGWDGLNCTGLGWALCPFSTIPSLGSYPDPAGPGWLKDRKPFVFRLCMLHRGTAVAITGRTTPTNIGTHKPPRSCPSSSPAACRVPRASSLEPTSSQPAVSLPSVISYSSPGQLARGTGNFCVCQGLGPAAASRAPVPRPVYSYKGRRLLAGPSGVTPQPDQAGLGQQLCQTKHEFGRWLDETADKTNRSWGTPSCPSSV
ncbi:hypothetical protein G7046_g8268 [Stylonectria norvegica]|nr:hypothetical protein G7046_g8268 [Stylonectria norvegica]